MKGRYPFQLNRNSQQSIGLVGWWPLAASAGGDTIRDCSERGQDSSFHNGTLVRDELWGGVSRYASQYTTLPTVPGMMTATVWIYQTSPGGNQCPFGAFGSFSDKSWWFNISGGACSGWTSIDGSGQSSFGNCPVPQNQWTHLAMVVFGNIGTLYVNGVPCGSNAAYNRNPTTPYATALGRLGAVSSDYFQGYIGDARIYNRALTRDIIWQMYDPQTRMQLHIQPSTRPVGLTKTAVQRRTHIDSGTRTGSRQ